MNDGGGLPNQVARCFLWVKWPGQCWGNAQRKSGGRPAAALRQGCRTKQPPQPRRQTWASTWRPEVQSARLARRVPPPGEGCQFASQENGPASVAMRVPLAAGAGPESAAGRGEGGLPLGGPPASANTIVLRSHFESQSSAIRSGDGADPLCQRSTITRPLSIYVT
jgi:hypothetical protein